MLTSVRASVRPALWYPQFFYYMRTQPLDFLPRMAAAYGPLVQFQLAPGMSIYLLSDPEDIRDVLVTRAHLFHKGRALQATKKLLGQGLLTSEGELHKKQRALMQPVFQRNRVMAFGDTMVELTAHECQRWQDGSQVMALEAMHRLTLAIVNRTLFDSPVEDQAQQVAEALDDSRKLFRNAILPFVSWFQDHLPPARRRFERARRQLDDIIYALIAEHRQNPRGDLLSLLIEANQGNQMSDEQLRDETLTLFLAGHETTANSLAWTLYLLASHPQIQEQMAALVPPGPLGPQSLEHLKALERVVLESLRLYPPAWIMGRMVQQDFELQGVPIKAGSTLIFSPYLMQREERFFPMPWRFDPSRWESRPRSQVPRYAFFPFGGGPRVCIGEHFAMMELVLVLARLLQDWRFELVSELPPRLETGITLRPAPEVPVRVHRRRPEGEGRN